MPIINFSKLNHRLPGNARMCGALSYHSHSSQQTRVEGGWGERCAPNARYSIGFFSRAAFHWLMCWGTKDAPRIAAALAGGIGAFPTLLALPGRNLWWRFEKIRGGRCRWRSWRAVRPEKDLPVKTETPHSAPQPPFHRIIASGGKALCV